MNDIYILLVLAIGGAISYIGEDFLPLNVYNYGTEVMYFKALVVAIVLLYDLVDFLL